MRVVGCVCVSKYVCGLFSCICVVRVTGLKKHEEKRAESKQMTKIKQENKFITNASKM